METSTTILEELKGISPLVAEISRKEPYDVPIGYFDGLAGEIFNTLKGDPLSEVLNNISKNTPYQVPQEYFELFSDNMLVRIKAEEAHSPKEELEALSPILSNLEKKSPFTLPLGYFEELPENVVSGTKAIEFVNEELENRSKLMSDLKNKNVYEVPQNYFDTLAGNILEKIKNRETAKIVSMGSRRKFMQYAAAAVLTGLIVTTTFIFFDRTNNQNASADPLAGIEQVSDEAILNYLETSGVSFADISNTASVDMDEEDVKELISDVPDEELQKYLTEFSNLKDLSTN